MLLAQYGEDNVVAKPKVDGRGEVSPNLVAGAISERIGLRTPKVNYDADNDLLIAQEVGGEATIAERADFVTEEHVDSFIDQYALRVLVGEGDITENISADQEGFFGYDFDEAGNKIGQAYKPVRNQARDMASRNGLEKHVQDFDCVGRRAMEMAASLDIKELRKEFEDDPYIDGSQVLSNLETARDAYELDQDPEEAFTQEDLGVELL